MARASSFIALLALALVAGCASTDTTEKPKVVIDDGKPIDGKTKRAEEPFRAEWASLKRLNLLPGVDTDGEWLHSGDGASMHVLLTRRRVDFHRHDKSDEILVVVEGVALIHLGCDERGSPEGIIIEGGQGVLIPAGTVHSIECHPEMAKDGVPLRTLVVFAPGFVDGDQLEVCSICRDFARERTFECPGCRRRLCESHRGPIVEGKPGLCKGCPGVETPGFVPRRDPAAKKPAKFTLSALAAEKGATGNAVREVARGEHASLNVVRATDPIPAHRHDHHSETVFVFEGEGTTHAADVHGGITDYPTQAGALFHFPRGRAHLYRPRLTGRGGVPLPPTRALSIFTPPFDPADRIPVPDFDPTIDAATKGSKPAAPGAVEQLPGGTPRR